jgi:hypothetical protein
MQDCTLSNTLKNTPNCIPYPKKKNKTTMVRKYNMSKEESRKITGHDKSEDQCAL